MKKYIKNTCLLSFFFLYSVVVLAQNTSYPVKILNGTEYYVYTVQAGEGLYAISKRFNVTQADINNANPQIVNGIKAGETILVPKKKNTGKVEEIPPAEQTEYILHKVEKKQTLFAISRIYNVPQDEIIAANPNISQGLHVGDMLRIPQKKSSSVVKVVENPRKEPTEKAKEKAAEKAVTQTHTPTEMPNLHIGSKNMFITHTVQPKETLYSISKHYNVTMEEIIKLNPEAENTIKIGSELKIPIAENNAGIISGNLPAATKTSIKKPEKKDTYKIAYLLPFMLDEKDMDATVKKFMDFYMGALLAVKKARDNGVNYEIYTYDTEKTETKIHSIINQPEMQQMDLIIGPAYTSQIPILADFAKRRQIYTVIPFSSKIEDIDENPYIIQFNPDKDLQNFFLANKLKNKFQNSNIVLIKTNGSNQNEGGDFYSYVYNRLNNSGLNITRISKSDLFTNSMEKYLKTDKNNLVIFDTDKLPDVQTYLNTLYDISSKYDVAVIGQYSWKDESGKKPKMYYIAPFLDDEIRDVNALTYEDEYTLYYGKLRGEKNPRYDMIGYDITKYFLSLMDKNGFDVDANTKVLKVDGVQSNMIFKRVGNDGGFMNQQLYLIEDAAKRK